MRNWNILKLLIYASFNSCFYSTYEELKPTTLLIEELDCFLGFYSTYEELKPIPCGKCEYCRSGFYSTYEELKLKDSLLIGITTV